MFFQPGTLYHYTLGSYIFYFFLFFILFGWGGGGGVGEGGGEVVTSRLLPWTMNNFLWTHKALTKQGFLLMKRIRSLMEYMYVCVSSEADAKTWVTDSSV